MSTYCSTTYVPYINVSVLSSNYLRIMYYNYIVLLSSIKSCFSKKILLLMPFSKIHIWWLMRSDTWDTKKTQFSLRCCQYKVSITWFTSSLTLYSYLMMKTGQNSRKNWWRGEAEHKCINILNCLLKFVLGKSIDIDLLKFCKKKIFLTVCNCRRCRQNIFFSLDKPYP